MATPEISDQEGETFEDAPDTNVTIPTHIRSASNASSRSLSNGRTSSVSSRSLTDHKESLTPVRPSTLDMSEQTSGSMSQEPTPRPLKIQPAGEEKKRQSQISSQDVATAFKSTQASPKATRLDSALFDDVQLSAKEQESQEVTESEEAKEAKEEQSEKTGPAEQRGRASTTSSNGSARSESRGSNLLAQFPFTRSSTTGPSDPKQLPSAMSRKLTSPFAWLSRKKTSIHPETSPPAAANRRRTATTGTTASAAPDLTLRKLDEDKVVDGRLPAKELLKERFKMLRMQEEAGVNIDQINSDATTSDSGSHAHSRTNSQSSAEVGLGIGMRATKPTSPENSTPTSPSSAPLKQQKAAAPLESLKSRSSSIVSHAAVDPRLAPGTAVGLTAGPSTMQDPEAPVDWDLWQAVVYEGPTAVSKTGAADLARAIASGIPSAIRGVVWQVLAGSKNEELEKVYWELVARGTEKEVAPSPQLASGTNANASSGATASAPHSGNSLASNASTHMESITSETSSVHSDASTPATTNGMTSPVKTHTNSLPESDVNAAKVQAAMSAERAKKAKGDLAALKKLEKTIRKDLGNRSNYSKYAAATGLQDALFGVCKAYALFDEGVGYAQGMNFIVMPLLFNMPEEEAFCLLVKVMNTYNLREMFVPDMPGLHLCLYQFERLLEDLEPALCYHLHRRGVVPSLYATQWFLTLFAYRFPLQLVLRIYDLILSEGLESALLKFALALMRKNAPALLALQDMAALKTFLNERLFDAYIDAAPSASSLLESGFFGHAAAASDKAIYRADLLVQDATAVPVAPELLKAYAADHAARQRVEREREAEFDNLRAANASLALKIRGLEGRAEKGDADHVQMASEMIRSKVETEEVKAKNEELKEELQGLKATVARQPGEVEARLQKEMERIMSRNIEVQNENRALEEGMAEMERDLVETKLRFAEINSEYEALKQKWADLRRALGD